MKKITLLICLALSGFCFGQNKCDCESELEFVVDYYEKNLPGFKDNVTAKTQNYYHHLKVELSNASKNTNNKSECFKLLTRYVEFFKDNHSSIRIRFPVVNEQDSTQLVNFLKSEIYTSREIISLKNDDLKQFPITAVKGLYQTKGGTYTIAIIPNKTVFRDYVGVIVDSKTKLWKKGQVKLELKKKANSNTFEAFVYMKNHSIQYKNNFTFKDGILGGSWFKTSLENKVHHATDADSSFKFKKLNDSIAYLKIPTFSGGRSSQIDSLYQATFLEIRKTPYLIVDVRNSGGGSDNNAMPLLEFIYTNKIKRDKVDLYVTPDNIKVWENWYASAKKDTANYSKNDIAWFEKQIETQKKAKPFSFIPRSKGGKMSRNYKPNAVKKVAIIQNRNSASSCETLLFWAMQSSKTILVGENSGGFVGYGEIGSVKTPCFEFSLGCTMTRYREQRKYEADGIPPNYYLSNNKDWIEQTVQLLKQ